MELRYGVRLALALLLVGSVRADDSAETEKSTDAPMEEEPKEKEIAFEVNHYPISWTTLDFKPIIDNERLFKKYKQCLLQDKSVGCPRDVVEMKKIIPEVLDTMCAKCLPVHVDRFKDAVEYVCKKRRADYDEVRKVKDPTGDLQAKFERKFGKVNC